MTPGPTSYAHQSLPPHAPKPMQPQPQQRTQLGATGARQATAGGQRQMYRQATLSFPPSWEIPQWSDGPDAAPLPSTHDEWPARDANGIPTGNAKLWGDDVESENEGVSSLYLI